MKRFFTLLMLTVACLGLNAQDGYTLKENIPYVNSADTSAYRRQRCKLDVYYPTQTKGFKTIVWFHGGGLEGGNKEIREELKGQGFAVVAPNYRLFPRCHCPQYIEDAAAAVAWTFAHIKDLGGDPTQIYVGGHSAGGYLTLMLCLDKGYLEACGVDADRVKAYYPVSGQCATHYTIRKERKISYTLPIVDKYAPLNNARKLGTRLLLFTGDRKLEQMSRYEENIYLKSVLEGIGNAPIPLYEMPGFDHGTVLLPACKLIADDMKK